MPPNRRSSSPAGRTTKQPCASGPRRSRSPCRPSTCWWSTPAPTWAGCSPWPPASTSSAAHPGVDLPLPDEEVSRTHAWVTLRGAPGNEVILEDKGSTNGTFLNDQPITRPDLLGGRRPHRRGQPRAQAGRHGSPGTVLLRGAAGPDHPRSAHRAQQPPLHPGGAAEPLRPEPAPPPAPGGHHVRPGPLQADQRHPGARRGGPGPGGVRPAREDQPARHRPGRAHRRRGIPADPARDRHGRGHAAGRDGCAPPPASTCSSCRRSGSGSPAAWAWPSACRRTGTAALSWPGPTGRSTPPSARAGTGSFRTRRND